MSEGSPNDRESHSEDEPPPKFSLHHPERPFIVEVDDEIDVEVMSRLLDPPRPKNVRMCTTEVFPSEDLWAPMVSDMQLIAAVRRVRWRTLDSANQRIHSTFENLLDSVIYNVKESDSCCLSSFSTKFDLIGFSDTQIVLTALRSKPQSPSTPREITATAAATQPSVVPSTSSSSTTATAVATTMAPPSTLERSGGLGRSGALQPPQQTNGVIITPMSHIPGHQIEQTLGYVNIHLIRESFSLRDELGIEGFATDFLLDVLAILRAHVASLQGNALLSFSIDLFHLKSNNTKDQGYCLISLSGDAVKYL